MRSVETSTARGREADRLVYGYVGGRHRGPRRTAFDVAVARFVDGVVGRADLARPAVLVSGFWRSGTTWLQESLSTALCGKTVFEPLSPLDPHRRAAMVCDAPADTEDLRQATIPGPQPPQASFWRGLDRACTGRRGSVHLLSCRHGIGDSFSRTIVVKDVRLQANLAAFHRRYRTPVVHIRRHPCAVVASMRAAAWHWSFDRTSLAELLPRLGAALGAEERAAALRFDVDGPSRAAAFWAVTERLAAEALMGRAWGTMLLYEAFAERPEMELARICARLGLRQRQPVDFATPSASVDPLTFAGYEASPAFRWRNLLSDAEVARIESIVDAIYPDWRAKPDGGR